MIIEETLDSIHYLGLDTAPFIYYVENNPKYVDKVEAIFTYIEQHLIRITTSVITLIETLSKPYQDNNSALIQGYQKILLTTHAVRILPVTITLAQDAAQLRAKYNLKTPDALQVATALEAKCEAFLTSDKGLKRS